MSAATKSQLDPQPRSKVASPSRGRRWRPDDCRSARRDWISAARDYGAPQGQLRPRSFVAIDARPRLGALITLSPCHLIIAVLFLSLAFGVAGAQPPEDERFTVIRARQVITISGDEIRDGMIVLAGGRIHSVGRDLEVPLNARVIDARDRVVMPGLINPTSRFGLPRHARRGVHGHLRVADEYFPSPDVYRELLDAGYTALALVPTGDGIPGRAIVVRTAGPDDRRVLLSPAYLRVTPDKKTFRGALEKAQSEIEKVDKAREEFEKKRRAGDSPAGRKNAQTQPATEPATRPATQPAFEPPPIDPAHQVLVDLIQKKPGLFALLELNGASDFVHMSDVLAKFDIAHSFAARNSRDSDLGCVVEALGERRAKLILQPLISRVPFSVERIHLVKMFADAGCEVSLTPVGDAAHEHQRMLARLALLVREGWPRADALKAVTLHPARLLGLDERLGTIEKGKDADLIFLDGDPLAPGVRVRTVMIAGEIVHRVEAEP